MAALKWIRNTLTLALILSAVACGSNKAQQAQENVDAANSEINRMNAIQAELAKDGIVLGSSVRSQAAIEGMSQAKLKTTDTLLNEYANRGDNALQATTKDGVAYSDAERSQLRVLVASSKVLREKVRARITGLSDDDGTGTGGVDDEDEFWKSYHACYDLQEETNWISGGIDMSKWKTSRDGSKFGRLSRVKKAKFRTDAGEFKRCIGVIIDGRTQLGHDTIVSGLTPKQTAIKAAYTYSKAH